MEDFLSWGQCFTGGHITYTQASPVKAASVAHCLGNRTLSLATAISIPSCCLLLLPSRSFLLRLLPLPTPLLPDRLRTNPPAAQMLIL